MKTTIGEIKSILDLFEKETELDRTPGQGGYAIYAKSKCRLCGEELTGISSMGAYGICDYENNMHMLFKKQEDHIEFHKTISLLRLDKHSACEK
jgi:hypothetical protein